MYDFHKRKSSPNEHIFEHKNFIKGKKELLKLIKRKSKKDNNNNINNNFNNMIVHYSNYPPYIANKLLPAKENDIIWNNINPNIYFGNNNKNNLIYNDGNKRKSSFSIDDNNSLNNSIHSLFQYKKTPFFPNGTISDANNSNNYNYIKNEFNNNNLFIDFKNKNNGNKEEKKITKKNLQNLLNYLMQSIDENIQTQKQLELKIDRLTKQNNEFMEQNKKMLEEILAKNDYNKKLEAVICFILKMIMPKSKMKSNPELKNLFLSNEPNNQFHDSNNNFNKLGIVNFSGSKNDINDFLPNNNNGGILEPFQAFLNKYYERPKNTGYISNKDNIITNQEITKYNNNILLDNDKYYYPINNMDNNLNSKILKKNLIGSKTNDNIQNNYQISPYMINQKRKRSSSFNSILSNFSKGSNMINSNKLLPEDEGINCGKNLEKMVEKNEENKIEKIDGNSNFSRKDSISSWNDGKNIFDIDMNQDENKSYLSGWNKDILNNSQTSFNDIYNNIPNNKDNDIFCDINN